VATSVDKVEKNKIKKDKKEKATEHCDCETCTEIEEKEVIVLEGNRDYLSG